MNNDKQIVEIQDETATVESEPKTLKLSREVVGVIAVRTGIKAGKPHATTKNDVGGCAY